MGRRGRTWPGGENGTGAARRDRAMVVDRRVTYLVDAPADGHRLGIAGRRRDVARRAIAPAEETTAAARPLG